MGVVLGPNQYGKSENRLVRIHRETDRHEIRDLNVSTALRGDFAAAHVGDQRQVLPTDTQKQTVYAYAKTHGVDQVEDFGLALARHFVDDVAPVQWARVEIEEYAWERAEVAGRPHDHTWVRRGQETRTTAVTVERAADGTVRESVVSGLQDLVVLKSTGSEFHDFLVDEYTVLKPTNDRVLATSVVARWRYLTVDADWAGTYAAIKHTLIERFAEVHSLALQQTLYEMGRAALEGHEEVAEIRFAAPNKHHFVYDLSPFGLANDNEVFHADDRPYGLIQATVQRDDVAPAPWAWDAIQSFC